MVALPSEFIQELWGIKFRSPIFNAAGIFKSGEGYSVAARQGAGAFLAGTVTLNPRKGNCRKNIRHPFAAFPKSHAAMNWMGLPNEGCIVLADRISRIEKIVGCPIGISVAASPDDCGDSATDGVLHCLDVFERAQADFFEINESCPNVVHDNDPNHLNCDSATGLDSMLIRRLEMIAGRYLSNNRRKPPLIVKFSNDTSPDLVPALLDLLLDLGYDGVNFGNTSTNYDAAIDQLYAEEQPLFDYFARTFGGGISGKPLKESSLLLASTSVNYLNKKNYRQEFHVIRTGGIDSMDDINRSTQAGIKLNEWFSGYFDVFSRYGHNVYKKLLETVE